MNQVDISPETVEREYDLIAERWGFVAANDDTVAANENNVAPEPVPEFEPERVASPETVETMNHIDLEIATLEKWKDDPEVTPEMLRHGIAVTNQSVSKLSKSTVRRMVGLQGCDDAIDEFVEALSPVIIHHYPKGGLVQFLSENGMYISLMFAAWGLGQRVYDEYLEKAAEKANQINPQPEVSQDDNA
ncbi:hypothetical protein L1D54_22455 [Vibrio brasiliensis]|uniref:hypothetical protein n=1 Tax=Vibrio brasiliensis TaxID=170652 RepID=UPI001EFDDF92|nr:hypothetical protein [Vibrio brasiliensis]MCG9753205.1 hypothetical protein [Vibrio brasiliensis]